MPSILKIASPYLDYRFSPQKNLRCRVLEQPGLWMLEEELASILAHLRQVAAKTETREPLDYGILSGRRGALEQAIITLIYEGATPVAFNAMTYMDVELRGHPQKVIHLGLVMVDPECRSQGFTWILYGLTCFLLFFRNQLKPIWVSNVTQVPAVMGSVSENYDRVYPCPRRLTRCSFTHRSLARQIMQHHRHVFGVGGEAEFDPDRFIIRNAYTGGSDGLKKSFAQAARHRQSVYNDFCRRALDYDRGDDVLQIAQINLSAARQFILAKVPKRSVFSVAVTFLFALLSKAVLPAVHWFDASRPMGEIRPWERKKPAPVKS